MKSIEVHYIGPTNYRGSRWIVSDGDKRKSFTYDQYDVRNEPAICAYRYALERFGPNGLLVGGDTKKGKVYVWLAFSVRAAIVRSLESLAPDARKDLAQGIIDLSKGEDQPALHT
jgi:hypothetical protein